MNGYYDEFGRSVALSGSGDTALIGGRGAVFERSGSTWVEEQPQLFVGGRLLKGNLAKAWRSPPMAPRP